MSCSRTIFVRPGKDACPLAEMDLCRSLSEVVRGYRLDRQL